LNYGDTRKAKVKRKKEEVQQLRAKALRRSDVSLGMLHKKIQKTDFGLGVCQSNLRPQPSASLIAARCDSFREQERIYEQQFSAQIFFWHGFQTSEVNGAGMAAG
jgi:hypothetical protein